MAKVSPTYSSGTNGEDFVPNSIAELGNMIGKIAYSVIRENTAQDKLAVFDKAKIDNGDTIEQAVVKMAESLAYDEEGLDALKREDSVKFAVKYFNDWTRSKFKKTVDVPEIRQVLLGNKDVSDISSKIVSSMTEGDMQEKYENVRDLVSWGRQTADGGTGNVLVKYATIPYDTLNSSINFKKTLEEMKNAVDGMKFVNTDFNTANLKRRTRDEDIYILMPYQLKNAIDVNDLAGVFNLSKAEVEARIITTDTGKEGTNQDYYIYIVDKHAVLDFTRLYEMVDELNADGLFWNYYLHVSRLYALSPLFDACYIKVETKENE